MPIEVTAVSARAARRIAASTFPAWNGSTIPSELAASAAIDVFVELIGGEEGAAKAAVETALRAGKHVVTANKALLAMHGTELARSPRANRWR